MNWKAIIILIIIALAFIGGIVYICFLDRWFFIPLLLGLAAAIGVMYLLRGISFPSAGLPIIGVVVLTFLLTLLIYYCIFNTEVRKAVFSYLVNTFKEGWYYPLIIIALAYLPQCIDYIKDRWNRKK